MNQLKEDRDGFIKLLPVGSPLFRPLARLTPAAAVRRRCGGGNPCRLRLTASPDRASPDWLQLVLNLPSASQLHPRLDGQRDTGDSAALALQSGIALHPNRIGCHQAPRYRRQATGASLQAPRLRKSFATLSLLCPCNIKANKPSNMLPLRLAKEAEKTENDPFDEKPCVERRI